MTNYRMITDEDQGCLLRLLAPPEEAETEWPCVDLEINDRDRALYPNRILIELSCKGCGQGFSSIKPNPTFCSRECYIDYSKPEFVERCRLRLSDPVVKARFIAARVAAGYPDTNRPEAVARRKLRMAAKNAVHRCIRRNGTKKTESSLVSVGYSTETLRLHMEALFVHGMSWDNYGEWEIDHKRPISDFPLDAPLSVINALSNLQPLWKKDNRKKHANVWL